MTTTDEFNPYPDRPEGFSERAWEDYCDLDERLAAAEDTLYHLRLENEDLRNNLVHMQAYTCTLDHAAYRDGFHDGLVEALELGNFADMGFPVCESTIMRYQGAIQKEIDKRNGAEPL